MPLEASRFLDYQVEVLGYRGFETAELEENSRKIKNRLRSTSSKIALITETGAGIGGFIKVGDRQQYHLSADLTREALLTGNTRKLEKVADHETVHLLSAQDIKFETADFNVHDAHFLAREYGLNIKSGESFLPALSRYLIEGLTEAKSQQRKWADPDCAYTNDEVPGTVQIVFDIQRELGINLFTQFNHCDEHGMAQTLKDFVTHLKLKKSFGNLAAANDNITTQKPLAA